MPLQRTIVDVPLSAGLQQQSDVRSIQQTGAVQMTNCVRQKNGAITKRYGSYALPNTIVQVGGNEVAAVRGQSYNRTPLLFDGAIASQFSDTENAWNAVDLAPETVALDRIPVSSVAFDSYIALLGGYDLACGNGYTVVIYIGYQQGSSSIGSLYAQVIDADGAVVIPATTLDSGSIAIESPRIIVCGTTAIIAYTKFSSGPVQGIYLITLNLANVSAGFSSPATYATTNVLAGSALDIAPFVGDATRFALAYGYNGGGSGNIRIDTVSVSTLTETSRVQFYTTSTISQFGFGLYATSGSWVWLTWWADVSGTTGLNVYGYTDGSPGLNTGVIALSTSNLSSASPINTPPWVYPSSNHTAMVAASFITATASGGTGYFYETKIFAVNATTSTVTASQVVGGVVVASKPALVTTTAGGSRLYGMVIVPSYLQGTQALVCFDSFASQSANFTPMRLVATVAPRLAKQQFTTVSGVQGLPTLPHLAQNAAAGANVWATAIEVDTSPSEPTIAIQPFDFSSQLLYFGDQIGVELGCSAGAPFSFDGLFVTELGFLYYPEPYKATGSDTGGFLTTGSTGDVYSYIAVYEWTDAAGQIHRSAAGVPFSVDLSGVGSGSTGSVAITLPCLGITWRQRGSALALGATLTPAQVNPVVIAVYRTQAGGTIYYRLGNVILNVPSQATVQFTDTSGDAGIGSNEILYTQAGILDNLIPPSARMCIQHTTRWILAGCDDPTVIWASKALTTGEIPGFNEELTIQCSGRVTAIASLDDKLISFVQRGSAYGIEYVTGLGPLDSGAQSDWTTPPQPIPSDVGAVDQRSIVVGPFGVIFRSNVGGPQGAGGIFLLSRDLQVSYLSGAVEDLLSANPVVTSAVLHPNAGRVYLTCAPSDALSSGAAGVRLVWDYLRGCWSQDVLYDFDATTSGAAARCAWIANGVQSVPGSGYSTASVPLYHWATPTGRVYRETTGQGNYAYVDSSTSGSRAWVAKTYVSAWIKPSMSGFARFWRVQVQSQASDASQLFLYLTYDYAPATYYAEYASWTDAQIAAFDRYPQVDVQMVPGNQKAKAIQITLADLQPSGSYTTGRGMDWATLSFELGVGDRAYPNLPAGQKA